MKLSVTTNIPIAITLPATDTSGAQGFTAISAAVAGSAAPSSAEKVVTDTTSYTQLIKGLLATSGWMELAS